MRFLARKPLVCVVLFTFMLLTNALYETCEDAATIVTENQAFSFLGSTAQQESAPTLSCRFFDDDEVVGDKGFFFKYKGNGNDVRVSTCDSRTLIGTQIIVFTECRNSIPANCIDLNTHYCENHSAIDFFAENGISYWIFVSGVDGINGSLYFFLSELGKTAQQCSVANDFAENELPLTTIIDTNPSQLTAQTPVSGWVHILPSAKQRSIGLSTCNGLTMIDSVVGVYENCINGEGQDLVNYNDDGCGLQSLLIFTAKANQDYWVFAHGHEIVGQIALSIYTVEDIQCDSPFFASYLPFAQSFNPSHLIYDDESSSPLSQKTLVCNDFSKQLYGVWVRIRGRGQPLRVSTCSYIVENSFDTAIFVYESCDMAKCVAYNDDYCDKGSNVVFMAEQNVEYSIFVGVINKSANIHFEIVSEPSGTNYSCQDSLFLNLPDSYLGEIAKDKTQWFNFYNNLLVTQEVTVSLSKFTTIANPSIEVYTSCDYESPKFVNKENTNELRIQATQQSMFYIHITSKDDNTNGVFELELIQNDRNENAKCNEALTIHELPFNKVFQTFSQSEVLDSCMNSQAKGAFFSFVGKGNKVIANTCGVSTNFDTFISVYDSCDLEGNMQCLYSNVYSTECGDKSYLGFEAEKDKVYLIFVGGTELNTILENERRFNEGIASLSVFDDTPPTNSQSCTNATPINLNESIIDQTVSALNSKTELHDGWRRGLWYSFVADGSVNITTCSSLTEFDAKIELYHNCENGIGTEFEAMKTVLCPQNGNTYVFDPKNETVFLFVCGEGSDKGTFELYISQDAVIDNNGSDDGGSSSYLVIIILAASFAAVVIVVCAFLVYRKLEKSREKSDLRKDEYNPLPVVAENNIQHMRTMSRTGEDGEDESGEAIL